eukprot:9393676-Alexandrium_andersonii.AAC.1
MSNCCSVCTGRRKHANCILLVYLPRLLRLHDDGVVVGEQQGVQADHQLLLAILHGLYHDLDLLQAAVGLEERQAALFRGGCNRVQSRAGLGQDKLRGVHLDHPVDHAEVGQGIEVGREVAVAALLAVEKARDLLQDKDLGLARAGVVNGGLERASGCLPRGGDHLGVRGLGWVQAAQVLATGAGENDVDITGHPLEH